MAPVTLNLVDAAELGELLQFLTGWLAADRVTLEGSLGAFVGHPGYDVEELRTDLLRFAFLLRHSDGEGLFRPES